MAIFRQKDAGVSATFPEVYDVVIDKNNYNSIQV